MPPQTMTGGERSSAAGMGSPEEAGAALRSGEELLEEEWLDTLIERASAGELRLTGEGGFLPELIKRVLERGLDVELSDHLGYERGDPAGRGSPNSRNGTTPKTVLTEVGPVGLDVPRDRVSSFEPRLVPKGSRRLAGGLDEMIISLYAGGMTVADIQHHLARTLGVEISRDTISKITDAVLEEVKAWQTRPLDPVYPIVYIDALVVKVRDGAHVVNKAAHLVVGVDTDGVKHVLGIWVQSAERAKFWLGVLTELRNRGVRDVLIACCDGLEGLPEAIETVWPHTVVQTSSLDTGAWRGGPAGHRAIGRGPMQTRRLRGPHADLSLPMVAGRGVASGSRASSAVMRFQLGLPVGDRIASEGAKCHRQDLFSPCRRRGCSSGSTGAARITSCASWTRPVWCSGNAASVTTSSGFAS